MVTHHIYMPNTVISLLHVLIHLILAKASQGSYCHYGCFMEEKTEGEGVKLLTKGHSAKWQN